MVCLIRKNTFVLFLLSYCPVQWLNYIVDRTIKKNYCLVVLFQIVDVIDISFEVQGMDDSGELVNILLTMCKTAQPSVYVGSYVRGCHYPIVLIMDWQWVWGEYAEENLERNNICQASLVVIRWSDWTGLNTSSSHQWTEIRRTLITLRRQVCSTRLRSELTRWFSL